MKAAMTVTNINYGIMIIALLCYSLLLAIGFLMALRASKRQGRLYNKVLRKIINELRDVINKEEIKNMTKLDKGAYKNTRSSEFIQCDTAEGQDEMVVEEKLTLTHLLTREPTDKEYKEIVDLLVELAQKTYAEYNFLIARSSDETKEANFLQLVSHSSEAPELHKKIFRKSIEYGINIPKLQKQFAHRVAQGKVVPLGDEVIVILEDGTGIPPTGCSPVNSGLEGGEIAFIISFIKKENLEAFEKHNLPQDEGNE